MKKLITILSLFIAFCSVGQIDSVYQTDQICSGSDYISLEYNDTSINISNIECQCIHTFIIQFANNGNYTIPDHYNLEEVSNIDSRTISVALGVIDEFKIIDNNTHQEYFVKIKNYYSTIISLHLEIDSLIACDFGYTPIIVDLGTDYNFNKLHLESLDETFSLLKNDIEVTDLNNLELSTGDSLQVKYNGTLTASPSYCIFGNNQDIYTPKYHVTKKENKKAFKSYNLNNDTLICPLDTIHVGLKYSINDSLGIASYSGSRWRWYKSTNENNKPKFYSHSDTISVTTTGKYTYASSNIVKNNQCPDIVKTHNISQDEACSAVITGNINEEGTYKCCNFKYKTLSNVKISTNTGLVTFSNNKGVYTFTLTNQEYDAINSLLISDKNYFETIKTIQTKDTNFRLHNQDINTYLLEESDLKVTLSSGRNRPGFTIPYTVTIENRGKDTLTTNISTLLDNNLTYTSYDGENTPDNINGQNLTWNNITVNKGETKRLRFYAILDRTTALGNTLQSSASLSISDDVTENNSYNYSPIVTGSFDPNDKLVSYTGAFNDGYITDTTSFEYTIRFQNSGTDTAFTVLVTDIIDTNLDLTSLEMIDASHNYTISYAHDTVSWKFSNILLPDSNTNEPASHGYIRFTIKQKDNNDQGTVINNKAYIYFDFNDPIITNEVTSIVDNNRVILSEEERIEDFAKANISVYPNPVKNKLKFKTGSEASLIIFNTIGDMMINTSIDNKSTINTENWTSGVYYYQITDTDGTTVSDKFVKE